MKIISIISIVFLLCGASFAQEIDKRLLSKYSTIELESMKELNPEKIQMLNYALDNALYVIDFPEKKDIKLSSIQKPTTNQTFIDLGLEIQKENQYFQIIGEKKMLVVKSEWVLFNELKTK